MEEAPRRAPAAPQTLTYTPGQYVFREEEHSFELFVLEEGTVEVFVSEEKLTEISEPGSYLGEIGALLKRPRAATVRAKTACRFTIYPDFQALSQADPAVLLKISETLAQRLVDMNERVDRIWGALYRLRVGQDVIDSVQAAVRGEKRIPVAPKKKWF
ncbi:cAMP-activated global transcriptional regulator CRP [compost metagenome]